MPRNFWSAGQSFRQTLWTKAKKTKKMRATVQRLAGPEYDARQPRLAVEADVNPDTNARMHTEDAAADRVISGDNSFAQVDPDPICLTIFGDDTTEPLALPRRDGVLVDKGTAVPKPCLSPVEMRTLTATGGLLSAGTAFQRQGPTLTSHLIGSA